MCCLSEGSVPQQVKEENQGQNGQPRKCLLVAYGTAGFHK